MPRMWFALIDDPKNKKPAWVRVASNGRLNDADFTRYQVRQTKNWHEVAAASTSEAKKKCEAKDFVASCDESTAPVVRPSMTPRSPEDMEAADAKAPLIQHSDLLLRVSDAALKNAQERLSVIPTELAALNGKRRLTELEARQEQCLREEFDSVKDTIARAEKADAAKKAGAWTSALVTLPKGGKEWVLESPDNKHYVRAGGNERCDVRVKSGMQILRYKLLSDSAGTRKADKEEKLLDHAAKSKKAKKVATKKAVVEAATEPAPVKAAAKRTRKAAVAATK